MSEKATDAIVIQNSKILLVQQRKAHAYGLWSFPGGHVDQGETLEMALRREIYEELSATLTDFQPFRTHNFTADNGTELELHTFLASVEGSITIPKDELLAFGWFALEELEAMADQLRQPLVLKLARAAFGDRPEIH